MKQSKSLLAQIFIVTFFGLFCIAILLTGVAVNNYYGNLNKRPSLNYNFTGKIVGACYYEGRKYGCNRNLTKLLEKD